ncbi:MAG: NAD(P)-dependent alcohol dehydrogenase [Anaerolineales bacterium]
MKVIVCAKYGPPEGLQLKEVVKPAPKENEVLIKIHATTVTFGDAKLRSFTALTRLIFGLFFGLKKNKILGHELAGEIEAVGDHVTRHKVGDQVFASTGMKGGAYAQYICLPEDGMIALKPSNLSYGEAAAIPVGGNTALFILRKGNIQPGDKVLIYGASGSVGTYAVQLAKSFGADVTGVCSTTNLELVRSLGANRVIDYTTEDFTESGEVYDVIFDTVRKLSQSKIKGSLKENGTFLSSSTPTTEKVEDFVALKELIEAGEIKPVIDRSFPLEQMVEAHRYVDGGHKKGNLVIKINQDEENV